MSTGSRTLSATLSLVFSLLVACGSSGASSTPNPSDSPAKSPTDSRSGAGVPAFPGAQGWGAETPGGRGGQVLYVTTLEDGGPGSLREALDTKGPRMILFKVSGIIRLKRPLEVGRPEAGSGGEDYSYVTIAGHSAPGGGVVLANHAMVIGGGVHDVVVRHLRFRNGTKADGISLLHGATRVVIDHCSVSWSTDENVASHGLASDVTIQNSIIAEGLHNGGHREGPHSMGVLVSRGGERFSFHHNYLAHNRNRNPQMLGNNWPGRESFGESFPNFDIRNNIIYDYGFGTSIGLGAHANVVANLYVPGQREPLGPPIVFNEPQWQETRAYLEGNVGPGLTASDQWAVVGFGRVNDLAPDGAGGRAGTSDPGSDVGSRTDSRRPSARDARSRGSRTRDSQMRDPRNRDSQRRDPRMRDPQMRDSRSRRSAGRERPSDRLAPGQISRGTYSAPPEARVATPFPAPRVQTVPAESLAGVLLPHVGALPRDATDKRLVADFGARRGEWGAPTRTHDSPVLEPRSGVLSRDGDGDGIPDVWEAGNDLDATDSSDGATDKDGNGYTELEDYLNELAAELEAGG